MDLAHAFETYNEACKASGEAVEACLKKLCEDLHVRQTAPLVPVCIHRAVSPRAC